MDSKDPKDFFERLLRRDKQAWEEFFASYRPPMIRLATILLNGDGNAAEDIVQDFLTKALSRGIDFRGEASVATYLHRAVYNAVISRTRRSEVRRLQPFPSVDPPTTNPKMDAESLEDFRARLWKAIHELREDWKEPILLVYECGLKYKEVADVLDVPLGTVKVRIFRAFQGLRAKFGDEWKELSR